MALNSMCATACSSAARPPASNALRAGNWAGDTSGGRCGQPGRPAGSSMRACVSIGASGAMVPAQVRTACAFAIGSHIDNS